MNEPDASDHDWRGSVAQRVDRVRARRVRHRAKPIIFRAATVLLGAALGLVAVPLVLVIPELGVPLAVAALSLLALEFEWAVVALERLLRTWGRIRRWYRTRSALGKALIWVVLVAVLVGLAWLTFAHV